MCAERYCVPIDGWLSEKKYKISVIVYKVTICLLLSSDILLRGYEVAAQGFSPKEISRSLTQEEKEVVEFTIWVRDRAYTAKHVEHMQELPAQTFMMGNMLNLQGAYQISPEDINSLMAHSGNGTPLPRNYKGPKKPTKEQIDWLMAEFSRLEKGCFVEGNKEPGSS